MFNLKKIHPPLGSADNPIIEASYSEGEIRVVDGLCKVRLPETRDRLLKIGYSEAVPAEGGGEQVKPVTAEKVMTGRKSRKRR